VNTPDSESIQAIVTKALLEEGSLTVAAAEVGPGTPINAGEFRIDSLAFIRAFIAIEDSIGIEFGDDALMNNRFSTFGEVAGYVEAELSARGAA
jgi:acyl carrier protein